MQTTNKRSSALLVLGGLVLLTIGSRFLPDPTQVSGYTLLVLACFLPFPWFITHLVLWMKQHSRLDEHGLLNGQTGALLQERAMHRSQIIAAAGGLYFLILAAVWIFKDAV